MIGAIFAVLVGATLLVKSLLAESTVAESATTQAVVVRKCPSAGALSRATGVALIRSFDCGFDWLAKAGLSVQITFAHPYASVHDPAYETLRSTRKAIVKGAFGTKHVTSKNGTEGTRITMAAPWYGADAFRVIVLLRTTKPKPSSSTICHDWLLGADGHPVRIAASAFAGDHSAYRGSMSPATICGWARSAVKLAR